MADDVPVEWVSLEEFESIENAIKSAEAECRGSAAVTSKPTRVVAQQTNARTSRPSQGIGGHATAPMTPVTSLPMTQPSLARTVQGTTSTPEVISLIDAEAPRSSPSPQESSSVPWQQNLPLKSQTPPKVAGPSYPPPPGTSQQQTPAEPSVQQQLMMNKVPTTVEYFLVSKERFSAKVSNNRLVALVLNQVAGMEYDKVRKRWTFPLSTYNILTRTLTNAPRVTVHQLPPRVRTVFVEGHKRQEAASLDKLPAVLLSKLMPFQREGILFALERGGRVLFGDEVGFHISFPCPFSLHSSFIAKV